MLIEQFTKRLETVGMLPEIQAAFQQMSDQDSTTSKHRGQWSSLIPLLYHLLGGTDIQQIHPFIAAWTAVYIATQRLDHLQDGDPIEYLLPTTPHTNTQYNLLLAYCLLTSAILDNLDPETIPASQQLQLRQLWNNCLLRVAAGQQLDLELSHCEEAQAQLSLEQYQRIAQAKTGAMYALAFGGAALLTANNSHVYHTMLHVGETYGTLLQLTDDFMDFMNQRNANITLPQIYAEITGSLDTPTH